MHDKQALFERAAEVKAELLSRIESSLSYLLPNGTFHGGKFYVGNIRGDKGKSLVVETRGERAGLWHDFATGEGGDILNLWWDVTSQTKFLDTIEDIEKWLGHSTNHKEEFSERLIACWGYHDENNQVIAKIYRYDSTSGKKRYSCFDVKNSSSTAPDPRPLYNVPGIIKSDKIVFVEGEKCAESLISKGITATTMMFGANSPVNKTDWAPLKGKHITIWPDNDSSGQKYAENVAKKLLDIGVASLSILKIPQDKPKAWDAADCIEEGVDVKRFLTSTVSLPYTKNVTSFPVLQYLNDKSPMPEDIIAPRVLTPSGLLVFAGAPKVGKSDFLISWLFHMASGIPFFDMVPKRPLRIFYLQTEIGYHYMRERLQQMKLSEELIKLAANNLVITPQTKLLLNENGIKDIVTEAERNFDLNTIDIIAVDPLRNVFDADEYGNENDNNAMIFFLQERVEKLRSLINPDAGVILVHHTKKMQKKLLEEDPFQSFSGASSLRGFYTTGMIMFRPDEKNSYRQLMFELRNGNSVMPKFVDKINGHWYEVDTESQRLINKDYGEKLDAERSRRYDIILDLIFAEGRKGHVYTINQFCQVFENKEGLGSTHSIRDRLDVLATKGYVKFNKEGKNAARNKYGVLCVEGMEFGQKILDPEKNKKVTVYHRLLPTHYKSPHYGSVIPVENPNTWVYHN
ncbi:AAA family ATPase [Wolbachia endosymbiont of Listronotus oregonensis]|uniref:AAA family ATPase n=1 Tax=Wolbachia endosymbiont of Listronotus oregonensis TaxID=2969106 RepID=UPI002815DE16|nr:AAA family ATPase [Wolbachia endosymbiont of Listronotus oregonensis]WMT84110.1 AAA family ATPase [Wolbachia endosymbiont of Listronotus oregonensis]